MGDMIKAPKGYEFKQDIKKLNIIIMFILSLCFTAQGQKQYDYEKYNFDWEFYYSDGYFTDTGFTIYRAVYNIDIKVYEEKLYIIFDADSANEDILWEYYIDEVDIIRGEKYDKYRFFCLDIKDYSYMVVDFHFKQKTIEICFYFVDEEVFLLLADPRKVTIN
jgi:hypothetical protein